MNLRRGLFRLWIVGSALFVIAVASISYGDINAEFERASGKWWARDPVVSTSTIKQPGMFDDLIREHGSPSSIPR